MRSIIIGISLAATFGAGFVASRVVSGAQAQGAAPAALTAQIISTADMKDADIGPIVPLTELRTRNLVVTEWGTIGIQVGNIFKHTHANANEIQFILEGRGTAWLGDKQVEIKPGDLIVIPKGTVHAGTVSTSGRFKALAIKLPPQRPDDTTRVD